MGFFRTLGIRLGFVIGIIGVWLLTGTAGVKGSTTSVAQSPVVGGLLAVVGIAIAGGISVMTD